ncbi:hypothetical protein SAMN04515665_110116 [Blastococcus sp. DSM 46786]|uniref:hypothetical protein n=1 Tax=Blastococcus sp. DSM 46786 TaxID=1798227 RepID=UPI0008C64DCF|nr:hypothetical protein [Blastococcus sp. DSM 46786]SEL26443.1 hypothetical protein SAMN04515665_110116 [Blastococcus sp. DSM 46786]
MSRNTAILQQYLDSLTEECDDDCDFVLVEDYRDIAAVMSMPAGPDRVRCADRWAETRSQVLPDGRGFYAVISREADGELNATGHADPHSMAREYLRISEDILGRPRGTNIGKAGAGYLLQRMVADQDDTFFRVVGLTFHGAIGVVSLDLVGLDDHGEPVPGTERSVFSLDGWQVL